MEDVLTVSNQELQSFSNYLSNYSIFLFIDDSVYQSQINRDSNQKIIQKFLSDFSMRYLIITKYDEMVLELYDEWNQEILKKNNVVLVKKSNFTFVKDMPKHKISEMIQIVNLNFENDYDPVAMSYNYVNKLMLPLLSAYKVEVQKKSTNDKNSYGNLVKRVNELNIALAQCQQNVSVPEVKLEIDEQIKQVVKRNQADKYLESLDKITEQTVKRLAQDVSKWNRDISVLLKTEFDLLSATTLQEQYYWNNLISALRDLERQMQLKQISLIIEVLKKKGKLHSATSFEMEQVNFKAKLNKADKTSACFKEIKLQQLVTTQKLSQLSQIISLIMSQFKQAVDKMDYQNKRRSQFIEVLSRDLNNQMIKILSNEDLMFISFSDFKEDIERSKQIFKKFEEHAAFFIFKKKITGANFNKQTSDQHTVVYQYTALKSRLQRIQKIRELYEKLKSVIEDIIRKEKKSSEKGFLSTNQIQDGYNSFRGLNILDISKEGEQLLTRAQKDFNFKIDRAETYITEKLREKLGGATSASEMFRIFAKFNELFFRQRIVGAIEEYQSQLLKTVKNDISILNQKFLHPYMSTQNSKICKIRDIPQTSGSVIWAKQINIRLKKYMDKISKILPKNWGEHPEGKECKTKGEQLLKKLNTQNITTEWNREISNFLKSFQIAKVRIFGIVQKKKYEVIVNFDEKLINLIKQIKNLSNLQIKLNYTITHHAKILMQMYPYAVSLQESIHSYNQISAKIDDKVIKLVAQSKKTVMNFIGEGFGTNWGQKTVLDKFSKNVAESILALHQLVSIVNEKSQYINSIMQTINTCPLQKEVLQQKLKIIQNIIDEFNLKEVSNLHLWVPQLNKQLEVIFVKRLESLIKEWVQEFVQFKSLQQNGTHKLITSASRHQLKTQNNIFYLDPPIEYAKFNWLQEFHRIIGIICSLPKLDATRYETSMMTNKKEKDIDNYESVIKKVQINLLKSAYSDIYKIFSEAENYIKIWLNYEALWVIDAKKIYEKLGEDINLWQQLLTQIRENRKTFDNSQTEKYFGPIIIDYRLVLNRINTKYDSWHSEILNHFGNKFGDKLKSFFNNLNNSKTKLEKINFTNLSADIVQMITEFQDIRKKYMEWSQQIEKFASGNKLLERQRYKYPADWLELQKVNIEWSSFKQIYTRKTNQLESEMTRLQSKINNDQKTLIQRIKQIEDMWLRQKPDSGDLFPKDALNVLEILRSRVSTVKQNYQKCCKAKQLLGLTPGDTQKLQILEQQIGLLTEVWKYLFNVWIPYENIKDTLIAAVTQSKVKQVQNEATNLLNKIPHKLKNNQPFESMKAKIGIPHGSYYKMNKKILQLKQESMKQRHWRSLLSKLGLKVTQSEVTFSILWTADLNRNQNTVRDILAIASGQNVLESMLTGVKEHWSKFELELYRYQSKCNLIKGWDDLFAKLDEDLNNLSSMKISQYYKTFEQQIVQWDDKLQKVRITMDTWIDVQRRWVYLQGIFMGSSDIKQMLNNQYTRFKGIDTQFTTLMKKVSAKPILIEIMNIQGLHKTLQRLSELLANVQKALGDYLQTQRSAFARFYFVGDQDLLQIIGNSKDVAIVQRHFTKMYAGITSLKSEKVDNNQLIIKMHSREGQVVDFKKPVNISEDSKINVWLTKVDNQMRFCLAANLESTIKQITVLEEQPNKQNLNIELLKIIQKYPAQVVLLGLQVLWSSKVDISLINGGGPALQEVEKYVLNFLGVLAESVMADLRKDLRQKFEQAITDFVHQRDVVRILMKDNINSNKLFAWLYFMRMIYFPKQQDILKKLSIQMANANFHYGFEYLGVGQKLVQTPLTDRCFLTLTQALHLRMGGAPFGPAGTGKTESVKALGAQLGRFVLVFNCDQTFDFHAMGRIFIGLCQVGAWGCFDQFNRLEERMLSACSQQILVIQTGLRQRLLNIQLMGKQVKLNSQMGSFVTMNPGYAGRSNLPENLKQLFRQMAMVKPDRQLIAQVMLYSQGYRTAQQLAGKIVSLFELCNDQLSSQPHYDFGLRALKSVLVSAGNMKREEIARCKQKNIDVSQFIGKSLEEFEQKILLRSVCQTVVPKLIAEDIPLLSTLLRGVFPGSSIPIILEPALRQNLAKICSQTFLLPEQKFIEKVLQLFQIQRLHHGLMMVGPSGCGKTRAWQLLMQAMEKTDKIKGQSYVIDPKAITKDQLYGKLDSTTLQWTDGVFTGVLRKITENQRGEANKRHWIIFDGDVDPEWAENLNSVLDDNKLLTLPNGQRIQIPPNVRIMFEVETLKYATLATVSRCGMVWFSEEIISYKMLFYHYLCRLKQDDYDLIPKVSMEDDDDKKQNKNQQQQQQQAQNHPERQTRNRCVQVIQYMFEGQNSFAAQAIEIASNMLHVMQFTKIRVIQATFALIRKAISNVLEYNDSHPELSMDDEVLTKYMRKWTIQAFMWGTAGSMTLSRRGDFSRAITNIIPRDLQLPALLGTTQGSSLVPYILIDFEIKIQDGEWVLWKKKVPTIQIDPQRVTDADLIITTVDTLRHQQILCSWLSEHRPFLLCGPPGSGKTMTLMSTLKSLPEFQMIFVNFSSSTSPSLIMKQFDHYCQYVKTVAGIILRPKQPNKWLVVFCDQINLPDADKYATMTVITFLRQLTQQKGFWRTSDRQWVSLQRIQFVGACNPPTDIGRKPLSSRFLRHCPLMLVDFPGFDSLKQIFGTFNKAMLKRNLSLRTYADCLTLAMIQFYTSSQNHFTSDIQPHYIYSPRELTRWKYAINQAIQNMNQIQDLVRLWAHEAMRLFQDRLVLDTEKEWCDKLIDEVAQRNFPNIKPNALQRPILFSNYLTKHYVSVDRNELRRYVSARLNIFYEQQLNVPIVVFDQVLEHILRIDRVLRQPLGHLLLVGSSGVGKTTLSRFVSWMNNISVFQIKAGRNYSLADFDEDLREVMKRAGVRQQKICFIFDQSNCLSPAFLEKMNALLASGQIPGLFQGQEYLSLINQFKQAAIHNKMMDADDQLYRNFIKNVQRNLHVVFTMNPNNPDFSNRTASSPALFNRCVIDWFGDWSQQGLTQVANEFTKTIDPIDSSFSNKVKEDEIKHNIVVNTIVNIHNTVGQLNQRLAKSAKKFNYITPRDFLDFIKHFVILFNQKKSLLEDQQLHLNKGLEKLKQTETQVLEMQVSLDSKKKELQQKQRQASIKMTLIVQEKTKANEQSEISAKLKIQLDIKKKQISQKKSVVEGQLAKAEPALEAAKKSVQNIDTAALTQIKGFSSPPQKVELALKPVYHMLQKQYDPKKPVQWKTIKAFMARDFIKRIIELNTSEIPVKVKDYIKKTYTSTPEWKIEDITRASSAAGALALWAESQLSYAEILNKVQPNRIMIAELQKQGNKMQKKSEEVVATLKELEQKTKQLQNEYETLIKQKQKIQTDMEKVQDKVSRSKKLLGNLGSEKYRWEDSSKNFKEQLATMLGDVFLSSAFLSYIGFFDHYYRKLLIGAWKNSLQTFQIRFRGQLSLIQFLSNAGQRLIWKGHKLPSDDLCTENAIILKRFNRYPLIIDPSGQAIQYITSMLSSKKFNVSSFVDDAFMKNLQTSLRFGCPLIVQDVEKVDPILNSVLNKQIYKTGGRVLIRVGDQEIDFSPNFSMYMVTRDSNAKFTPDLCSRVTFVNFTITPSSLQDQCLNIFLKNQRPDTQEKRINLMKLQGQYIVRLRELEDSLLDALNTVQGSILQSETVIGKLQTLKTEASKVTEEMKKSNDILTEVEAVTNGYKPLAECSSKIFFALLGMANLHYLYEYSLQFFMDTIFNLLEHDERLNAINKKEQQKRKAMIFNLLFQRVFLRVCNSLLTKDILIFALKLAYIKSGKETNQLFGFLIKASVLLKTSLSNSLLGGRLNQSQLIQLQQLSQFQMFSNIINEIDRNQNKWIAFLEANNPQDNIPQLTIKLSNSQKALVNCIFIKIFRPDKFNIVANIFLRLILGDKCIDDQTLDLKKVIISCKAKQPILLSSAPGFDPSFKVESTSKQVNSKLIAVAIGSSQGFELAEKAIKDGVKMGHWVMLKNVHLAPSWLSELEKKIHVLNPHQNFRLFLTAQFSPKIPSTLIRQSYKLVFQPPDGIKASLLRTYKTVINPARSDRAPVERSRLHFLLAWLHAVIIQRLRYTPIGWTKVYQFNEADQRCALDLIDEYIDNMGSRNNVDIEKIPWDAFKTILIQNLYGGKIDNEYDSKVLISLVEKFFTSQSFDSNYPLYSVDQNHSQQVLKMPEGIKSSQFMNWIQKLPDSESPAWSGLPVNVEKILKSQQTERILGQLLRLQDVNEQQVTLTKQKKKQEGSEQVAWLKEVYQRVRRYSDTLPLSLSKMQRTEGSLNDPLFRFLQREVTVASGLLSIILKNNNEVKQLCQGKLLATNNLKSLAKDIHSDTIPKAWIRFTFETSVSLNIYVLDLKKRYEQFNRLISTRQYQKSGVWFGGLLFPEAYMTATRQFVAQKFSWSLEQLEPYVSIYNNEQLTDDCFLLTGLTIEGAEWNKAKNILIPLPQNSEINCPLPPLLFRWIKITKRNLVNEDEMMVPVYLNRTRKNIILSIKLKCGKNRTDLYQKGVAVIAWC